MICLRKQLALATISLLSTGASYAEYEENNWKVDSSLANYTEEDRVSVTKIMASVNGNVSETDNVSVRATHDTMTGATPTGAVQANSVVTITNPSGGGGFDATGGSAALAPFNDNRLGLDISWKHDHTRQISTAYTAAVSIESDYRSYGASTTLNYSTNSKATTFSVGVGGTADTIYRVGGANTPQPLSNVQDQIFFDEGERATLDWLLGVTQVLNRYTTLQFNYTQSASKGYLTDPYKMLSSTDSNEIELNRFFEKRPDSRARTAASLVLAHQIPEREDILHLSYRFYDDDWDIKSHTVDLRYLFKLGNYVTLGPHLRYYQQTAAYFFRRTLNTGEPLPSFASADYRLDDMTTQTVGLGITVRIFQGGLLRARFEQINQEFEQAFFSENNIQLYQISYQHKF